jgi:hypothetical protein
MYNANVQPKKYTNTYMPLNSLDMRMQTKQFTLVSENGIPYGYLGSDPKLVDSARAQRLILDRPNYLSGMCVGDRPMDTIYTPAMSKYGGLYRNYADVTAGQIQYYVDNNLRYPYIKPVYVTEANVDPVIVTDPMGQDRIDFRRSSLVPYGWDKCKKTDCLSFTHDTLEFRQELMEKQFRDINSRVYQYQLTD